jgi:hypothetical protein
MATIVPHGKGFRVQIRKKGCKSVSCTFRSKEQAQAWIEQTGDRLGGLTLKKALERGRR